MSKNGCVFIENGLVKYEDYSALIDKCEKALKDNRIKDKEIAELKEDLEEYKQIGIMHFSRPYAKRYLEEKKKEIPNLLYPDSETIYKEYYDLRDRIDKTVEDINNLNHSDWVSLGRTVILNDLRGDKE